MARRSVFQRCIYPTWNVDTMAYYVSLIIASVSTLELAPELLLNIHCFMSVEATFLFFLQSCGLLLSHLSLPFFFRKCSSLMNFNNQRIIIDGFWWLISVELTKQVERINTQIHWCCLFKLLTFQLIYFSEYFYLLEHVGLTFFFASNCSF